MRDTSPLIPDRPPADLAEMAGGPDVTDQAGIALRFGEGRISGVLAISLGLLSLFAVLCFRHPELLTTADLRAVYPVPVLRGVLFGALLLALGSSFLSLLLARSRGPGLAGLALTGAAIALGGAWVETPEAVPKRTSLGLDWFVLDLLLLAIVFVPTERAFARLRDQRVLRPGFATDVCHFFASHLLVQVSVLLAMAPAALLFRADGLAEVHAAVRAQPLWLQALEILLVADLFQYAAHRAMHAVPLLWRFHAIHHSSRALDWLAGSRLHLVDSAIVRAVTFLPLHAAGFHETAMVAYLVFVSFHAVWLHANWRFELRWLSPWLATPAWHHWHHARDAEGIDVNFAVHLPVIDRVFGTAHLPPGRWPTGYGIAGDPVPEGYAAQVAWPFRKRSEAAQ
jgi:lathosterol oxidase